jgi:hypothetical protein
VAGRWLRDGCMFDDMVGMDVVDVVAVVVMAGGAIDPVEASPKSP